MGCAVCAVLEEQRKKEIQKGSPTNNILVNNYYTLEKLSETGETTDDVLRSRRDLSTRVSPCTRGALFRRADARLGSAYARNYRDVRRQIESSKFDRTAKGYTKTKSRLNEKKENAGIRFVSNIFLASGTR